LFYNATTVCLFVLVFRGWEYGGGRLRGIVGHFQIANYIIEICALSSLLSISKLLFFFFATKKKNTYQLKSEKNVFYVPSMLKYK